MENYRYLVCTSGNVYGVRVIFLDRGRELSNFHNLVITGLGVTILGLTTVFILMLFLSAYITKRSL